MQQLRFGSGELGSALARRWAQAGCPVIIGSRSADRAIEAAAQIGQQVRGAENIEAAKAAEVIVVAVPYSNHAQILEAIKPTASGKSSMSSVRTTQNLKEYVMTGLAFRTQGRIASIVFDRPNEQNLLSRDLLLEMRTIAKDLASDPEIQVLTLTGEGTECFSTGILTPALRGQLAKDQVLNLIRLANETFDAIEALPQIVIAGLNGYVRAGAVELALACDIRIAGNHVRLSSPEAKWGGFPGAGAPVRLPNIVGTARTLELLCTGREIDATELERYGLVERVVPRDDVHAEMHTLAEVIAGNGPLATRGTKRIVKLREAAGSRAARELSDALRSALEFSHDVDEGITAARERRKPQFTGR